MNSPVYAATAIYPGIPFAAAVALIQTLATRESGIGAISTDQVQLCPQNRGLLNEELVDSLRRRYPATRFRPHANLAVAGEDRRGTDASRNDAAADSYFRRLAELCGYMNAPAYSLHAGTCSRPSERTAAIDRLFDRIRLLNAWFPCPVAVEPLYRTPRRPHQLLGTWDELERLLDSGVPFALDLSHLAIVARQERRCDTALTDALLLSPQCIELHVSANDGLRDEHRPLDDRLPWWWSSFRKASQQRPELVVFSEGNQVRGLGPSAAAELARTHGIEVTEYVHG